MISKQKSKANKPWKDDNALPFRLIDLGSYACWKDQWNLATHTRYLTQGHIYVETTNEIERPMRVMADRREAWNNNESVCIFFLLSDSNNIDLR